MLLLCQRFLSLWEFAEFILISEFMFMSNDLFGPIKNSVIDYKPWLISGKKKLLSIILLFKKNL